MAGDDGDGLLELGEVWLYQATAVGVVLNANEELTNVVTVTAEDDEGTPVEDEDTQTVTGQPVDPAIQVVKTASTNVIDEGTPARADVTYTYEVTNESSTSTDPLTILTISDSELGDLSTANFVGGDDGDGLLELGEVWLYQATAVGVVLNANEELTNVVTVTAEDDEGTPVEDEDTQTVTGQPVDPAIQVVKTASTNVIDEGTPTDVTYTYEVTNESSTSTDPLTILTISTASWVT